MLLIRSILENFQLPSWARYGTPLRMDQARLDAERMAASMSLVMAGLEAPVSSLSGGNAQKVVIGKWLLREPKLLLLNDPTKGVDVGSKAEFYTLLSELRQAGTAILFYSSDDEELLGLCDRVLVMHDGRIRAELTGPTLDSRESCGGQHGRRPRRPRCRFSFHCAGGWAVNRLSYQRLNLRHPYLFALVLLLIALGVNYFLQPNLFESRVLNSNVRTFLPLMILAAGQTIVIIAGGIDLSVGAMVSLTTAVLVTNLPPEAAPAQIALIILLACAVGMAAGALNGFCVAFLRLQPIVTTYATSFIFSGIALWILPRPGGSMPTEMARFFRRATPLGLPLGFYVIFALIVAWIFLRGTRFGSYLFAVGGQPEAAYATGVPVNWVRFSTYVIAGLMAASGRAGADADDQLRRPAHRRCHDAGLDRGRGAGRHAA